ncbi:MAG: hypothetical protein ACXWGZ_00840 [Candidatus Aminicenantales bacterium]
MTRKLTITLVVLAALAAAVPSGLEAQAKPVRKAAPAAPAKLDASNVLKGMNFRSIGPTQQSGRFVDFAVPAGRPNIFYAASASGGLWKTENNGQTFEPLFENEKVFSIGDIAVAPSDPAILWLGSGEANNSRSTYWGDGIYKSVDGGKTWLNAGLRESQHIGRIVIHPSNPDIVYVAALGHLYSENLDRGVYKTTDGGKTWAQALGVTIDGRAVGAVDIVMDPSDPETLYAATYDKFRKPWTWGIGGPGSGIHKTVDGGKTWTRLSNGLPSGILGRIGLAIAPKDPKIVYAEIENANKPGMSAEDRYKEVLAGKSSEGMIDGEIYRSDDAGATWAKVSPEKRSIGGNPGYYYGQIIVDPNDSNVVYILSVGVLASRDGGKTWNSPFRFGGDNHALWIDPKDSAHMLLGYDHGMGLTWDGGKNWYHPDFLSLAQFYAIDFDMSYPYRVAGGLQDNGNLMGPSTNVGGGGGFGGRGGAAPPIRLEDWFTVGGGDGMYNVFDRTTNRTLYNESQFGPLTRVDLVTGEAESIAYQRLKPETRWNWCAPILVSAHANETIYHCGNLVVMSTNRGESWTEISPDLSTNDPSKLMVDGKGETATSSIARSRLSTNRPFFPACSGPARTTATSGSPATTARPGPSSTTRSRGIPGIGSAAWRRRPRTRRRPTFLTPDSGTTISSPTSIRRPITAPPGRRSRPGWPRDRSMSSGRIPRTPSSFSLARTSARMSRSTAARPGRSSRPICRPSPSRISRSTRVKTTSSWPPTAGGLTSPTSKRSRSSRPRSWARTPIFSGSNPSPDGWGRTGGNPAARTLPGKARRPD